MKTERMRRIVAGLMTLGVVGAGLAQERPYVVVDTGQTECYDNSSAIGAPTPGAAFHGQDAQHEGPAPNYVVNGDGTVTDLNTGLMWQRSPDTNGDGQIDASDKLTAANAQSYPASLNAVGFGGYYDWRLPSIKELYSLIDFRGVDPSGVMGDDTSGLTPFIDAAAFDFAYGDTSAGERIIDSQWATTTYYVDTADGELLFGVNFADGRIKGYGTSDPFGREKTFFAICVRGNTAYGENDFVDNGDGTITDRATGLMWDCGDSTLGLNWEDALAFVQMANADNYLGHDDWRLPNIKELQSIVDYTRSPGTTGSAAIDPIFEATPVTNEEGQFDWGYYWSGTTHANEMGGQAACYVAFGRGLGYMNYEWRDVHGAGCQRSDPKEGDPGYHGPQGDAQRVENFVRMVRDADGDGGGGEPVAVPPEITSHPEAQTVDAGASVTFSVTATGSDPLAYVWQKDGADITGANAASYTIPSAAESDEGTYRCVVSNAAGTATSNGAALSVNDVVPEEPRPRRRPQRPPRPRRR